MKRDLNTNVSRGRRGVIAPIVAVSLLVVMGGVALVLDRLWLGMARVEMRVAAEAAAIAAARELASDDLLKNGNTSQATLTRAIAAAGNIASQNLVAGVPLQLNVENGADVRFGVLVNDGSAASTILLETTVSPTTAVIMAKRTRLQNNPVSLFLQNLTQQPAGDVVTSAEATVDNRVLGLRPLEGASAPVLPLAILAQDTSENRHDTWMNQIENRGGADKFGYDLSTGQISSGSDGIPEIMLHSVDVGKDGSAANVMLLELGHGHGVQSLPDQILNGLFQTDLQRYGGALLAPSGILESVAKGTITGGAATALEQIVGQCRVCLLYQNYSSSGQSGWGQVQCTGLVAGRILSVTRGNSEERQIVFQPGVIATRTAVLAADFDQNTNVTVPRNKYIYKLTLTQ